MKVSRKVLGVVLELAQLQENRTTICLVGWRHPSERSLRLLEVRMEKVPYPGNSSNEISYAAGIKVMKLEPLSPYQHCTSFLIFCQLCKYNINIMGSTKFDSKKIPFSRRLATLPPAMRFRQLKETSKASVGVYRSHIHGRGLFCKRDIEEGMTFDVIRNQV